MKSIFQYIFLIFSKTRLFFISSFLILIITVFSFFLGHITTLEQNETAIILSAGFIRYTLILLMILFISYHIAQMYENKQLDFLLTKAVKRHYLILAYFFNIAFIAFYFSLIKAITLLVFTTTSLSHLFIYHLSLMIELLITGCFTLIAGLVIKKHLLIVVSSIIFYITSRLSGLWLMIAKHDIDGFSWEYLYKWLPQKIMMLFNLILPRFDLITQSEWLIYHEAKIEINKYMPLEWLSLILLLLIIGCYDLKKQEF